MKDLAAKADCIISLGTRAGESWLLTAEMVELIELGAPNIICAQPFACLPNHVVGKGMFAELRRRHPQANIVSVDYDPGASETNQLNRIKLMVATAHKRHPGRLGRSSAGPAAGRTSAPVSPVDLWDEATAGRLWPARPLPRFLSVAPSRIAQVTTFDLDPAVRPQDDLFRHVNGRWLASTPIPDDRPSYGATQVLREQAEGAVHATS